MNGAPDRREVDEAITFFFAPPREDMKRYRHGETRRSVLALVRQEAIDCLVGHWCGEDVVAARPDAYHRLFAAAMVLFAGLDLLAKFFSGSDESRQAKHRFVTFVQRFMRLTDEDAETVWQVRNALMHSFGLYDPRAHRTLAFDQRCPRPDLSASPVWADGPVWHLCLHHLYNAFLRAIHAYHAALATDAQARERFHTMFPRYGSIAVRLEPNPEPQADP